MKLKVFFAGCASALLMSVCQLFGAPVINSFTPTFGYWNDPTGITITGTGFGSGSVYVEFNGVRDTTAYAPLADGTRINAHVPPGAPYGAGPIYVWVNGYDTYSADDFTVIGPGPYITDFLPQSGGAGAVVTINGAHFVSPFAVYFNGVFAPVGSAPTPSQISVTVPFGVTTGPIAVQTTYGTYISASNFYAPLVLTGFSPTNGRAGTNVLITGTNLLGATAVRFYNNLNATSFTVLSNNAIEAVVPAGAVTGPIRVFTPAGSLFTTSNFVVQPIILGFSPSAGPAGTSVTITGANLSGASAVSFGGAPAPTFYPTNTTSFVAVVPAGATTGPITVTTTNGTAASAANFHLPAVITSFAPSNSAPGTLVAIKGTNFTDTSAVDFGGTPAAAVYVTNNTSLGAVVPANVLSGPINVTTPAGTASSASNFYGAPVIMSFNPTHGLPGTNVTLSGLNFLGTSAVRFSGSNATFSVSNNTTINATVPDNAPNGPITVIAPAGSNTSTQSFALDYTANLSLTVSDTPDPLVVGDALLYTITLVNNGPFASPVVTLTNTLPGTVNLIAAATTQGTLNTNANPVTGNLGPLGVGASLTVTLKVTPQVTGNITNVATVAGQYPDPVLANNAATNRTFVQPLPILGARFIPPNLVLLSWSSTLSNYSLEYKSFITTNTWSSVPTTPVIVGNERQVTETNNQSPRFYRLHRLP